VKAIRSAKSWTPWDLAQLVNAGDENARRLFVEYAEAIVGTRSGVVSAALAKKLGIKPSEDDDDVGSIVEGDDETHEINVEVESDNWRKLLSYGVAWQVIEVAETATSDIPVRGVIATLIDEIHEKERLAAVKFEQHRIERKKWHVDPEHMARRVIEYAAAGYSWKRSHALAIADQRSQMALYGKSELVLPDITVVGANIARLMEARW
jgi:hypothetical protein